MHSGIALLWASQCAIAQTHYYDVTDLEPILREQSTPCNVFYPPSIITNDGTLLGNRYIGSCTGSIYAGHQGYSLKIGSESTVSSQFGATAAAMNEMGQALFIRLGDAPDFSLHSFIGSPEDQSSWTRYDPVQAGIVLEGKALNNRNQGLAQFLNSATGEQGTMLLSGGDLFPLGALPGTFHTVGLSINDAADVVGFANRSSQCSVDCSIPVRYSNGTWLDLSPLAGPLLGGGSQAIAINNAGQIAGLSSSGSVLSNEAWLLTGVQKSVIAPPSALAPETRAYLYPKAMNEFGFVIGDAQYLSPGTPLADAPFIYHNGTSYELTTLLEPNSGWNLINVFDINEHNQILAQATDRSGVLHAVRLDPTENNPFPRGVISTGAPPDPDLSEPQGAIVLPGPTGCEVGERKLVLVVHGWLALGIFPDWPGLMADEIRKQINQRLPNDACNWDVAHLDWRSGANVNLPHTAVAHAKVAAETVYEDYKGKYRYVHLIAHSAGSKAIETLAASFKSEPNPPTVHETFLDAYSPKGNKADYGCQADFAESYVDMRSRRPLGDTNLTLAAARNVDISKLDEPDWNGRDSEVSSTDAHSWPHQWYRQTLSSTSSQYGFGLTREAGQSALPSHSNLGFERGARICLLDSTQSYACPDISTGPAPVEAALRGCFTALKAPQLVPQLLIADNSAVIRSPTGEVQFDRTLGKVALATGSPAWIKFNIALVEALDSLHFDYAFLSDAAADGQLSVYIDDKLVFIRRGRMAARGSQSSDPIALGTLSPGIHSLAFRLDPTNDAQARVGLSNMELGRGELESVPAEPPSIESRVRGTLSANGWYTSDVTVSWEVDGKALSIEAQSGCSSAVVSADTDGTVFTCSASTSAGFSTQSVNIKRDTVAPIVRALVSPAPGASGWHIEPVTVSFSGSDTLSGLGMGSCDHSVLLTQDGADQTATGSCRDLAGNGASATATAIHIDRTPPQTVGVRTPEPNSYGWNNSDVSVELFGTDSMSGSGIGQCSDAVRINTEGSGQSASGVCRDVAGNASTLASVQSINIDKTVPAVTVSSPQNGATYRVGATLTAIYQCTDAAAGVAACTGSLPNGGAIDTSTAGTRTLLVTGTDFAGNASSTSVSFTIAANPVDTTAPIVEPIIHGTTGENGWYRSNISVAWRVMDSESTIARTVGCQSHTITHDTNGTTLKCAATSAGGTTKRSVTVKRDATPPKIAIWSPISDLRYPRHARIHALYDCVDFGSGVAACSGSVPSGSAIDTATLGPMTFSVTARDRAGNSKSTSVRYIVR